MVWAVDGDGCFQMTAQELITAAIEKIPIKVALMNNSNLGMVRQWQEMFYGERFSEIHLGRDLPNYVMWAESMGCAAFRVDDPSELDEVIEAANAINDRPVVVEFRCVEDENVFPMVSAGASNSDALVDPSQQAMLDAERVAKTESLRQTASMSADSNEGVSS
jgi:acetolactate synthase-1/2/3 large subunit